MPERPEALSTSRPSALRLWGFLTVVVGAALAGLGALSTWAVIGFEGDTTGAADVASKGVDTWEGVVVLACAVGALIAIVVLRLVGSTSAKRALAASILVLGIVSCLSALSLAARAEDRLGGFNLSAERLAEQLDRPVAEVRAELERQFGDVTRFDLATGVWLAVAGGALITVGGVLALVWAGRQAEPPATDGIG